MGFFDNVVKLLTDSLINCTNKNDPPPSAVDFLSHAEITRIVVLLVATLIFMMTLGLFVLQLVYIGRYCEDFYRRAFVMFIANTPCFISFFALSALYLPRVWFLSYLFSFLYFSMAIYVTVCLLLKLLDGRQQLVKKMHQANMTVTTQTPPFCCFFFCMPELPVHIKKIRFCEMIVMQCPLVRLVCTVISLILYFEMFDKSFMALKILDFISLPSLLLGIYGMHILSNTVSKLEEISHTRYIIIFRIVDIFFMIFGLQTPIFELTARAGGFGCGSGSLNAIDVAYWWKNFAIVVESFIISVISSILLKPSKTGLFDKYNSSCRSTVSSTTSNTTTASTLETAT